MAPAPRASKPQASVWLNESAGGRRKRSEQPAGLDHEKIVKTTVRLLDAHGLQNFSMRRLAAELGVTPMSVYWYVDNKDDLLEYALDEAFGEVPLPAGDAAADWRDTVRELALSYRRMLATHPWASRLMGEYANVGPKSVAFSTVAHQVMQRAGLPPEMIPGALAAVYQFVYGYGTVEGRWTELCRSTGASEDDLFHEMADAVRERPQYQDLTEFIDLRTKMPMAQSRDRDFTVALECVIAGIEVMRDRG
ncbi:TetR/AcrR family transcriptional regulator [Streptantibioticus ferralitis]|uniref:TetR/AcrR family transcriptional regulator C-terminal domain-containing protein n=1 Tax=Streptantibioticus ferralitis TaxID=236510 RepID=A0ABT5Z1B1_9ACTN|nr:TetR/AcrR family transcriptional regulator C-terminal domain-containing protein [Streptantibioticus ferralitis]MDF2257356.1 TetR/AcrR family transcriptional regulator C-terminal domain-containing protein [Streptantibioticus ferralitis]